MFISPSLEINKAQEDTLHHCLRSWKCNAEQQVPNKFESLQTERILSFGLQTWYIKRSTGFEMYRPVLESLKNIYNLAIFICEMERENISIF